MRKHRRMWALGLSFALLLSTFSDYSSLPHIVVAAEIPTDRTEVSSGRSGDTGESLIELNERNFPDENFRAYVKETFDTDGDNRLSVDERESISCFECTEKKEIRDLTGIGYFTELTELEINQNLVTELDLTGNIKLQSIAANDNQLSSLNVSKCTKLTRLSCKGNQLSSLDISKCTELTMLICDYNQLSSLDVSKCTELTVLSCGNNQLSSLDLSKCTGLTELYCGNNRLSSLDLSVCTKIECVNGGGQKIEVEIRKDGDSYKSSSAVLLQSGLECLDINNDILASGRNTEEGYTWISDPLKGRLIQTINYRLSLNIKSEEFNSNYNDFLTLEIKFVNADWKIDKTEIPVDEEHFPDPVFRKCLKNKYGDMVQAGTITSLDLSCQNSEESIQDLTGIEYFSALYDLSIKGHSSLYRLNLSKNSRLSSCDINQTALVALYLPENYPQSSRMNTQITATAVEENGRYVLDLSAYGGVDEKRVVDLSGFDGTIEGNKIYWDTKKDIPLSCTYAFLTRSDYEPSVEYNEKDYLYVTFQLTNTIPETPAGQMVELTEDNFPDVFFRQYLSDNYDQDQDRCINTADITALSLDNWNEFAKYINSLKGIEKLNCLQSLYVANLPLSGQLDLSSNKVLNSVTISGTTLTGINVSGCVYLETLVIASSSLITIDLSHNKGLRNLDLNGNSLTELDLSHNKGICSLNISSEAISALDLSNMTNLEILKIFNTASLKKLNLTSNLKLRELLISGIDLTVDFSKLTKLQRLTIFQCSIENSADIEQIDLMHSPDLYTVCLRQITGFKELKLAGLERLKIVEMTCCTQLKSLDLSGCVGLTELDCDGERQRQAIETAGLETLTLTGAVALKRLDCSNNQLSELDVSDCAGLQSLYCSGNNLTTIDTSQNAALKTFECSNNPIEALDLSNNRAMLTNLTCINGALIGLDVSENSLLEYVQLDGQNREITADDFIVETLAEKTTASRVTTGRGSLLDEPVKLWMKTCRKLGFKGAGQSEKVRLNLAASGSFDPSKVSKLSSGTLTATGIEWDDVSDVPEEVNYEYDISNAYKLSGQKMQIKLSIKSKPKQDVNPPEPSVKPSNSPLPSSKPSNSPLPSAKPSNSPLPSAKPSNSPLPSVKPSNSPLSSAKPSDNPIPEVSEVKNLKAKAKKKSVQVSWKKLSSISGYELQYATQRSFKKAKKVELSKSKRKYMIKKLKSKKKYYIRIRAYKIYKNAKGKKVKAYGKYTKVTVKVK